MSEEIVLTPDTIAANERLAAGAAALDSGSHEARPRQEYIAGEFVTRCMCGRRFTGQSPDDADGAHSAHADEFATAAPVVTDAEVAAAGARLAWLSARLLSDECTGASAVVTTHKIGNREGYRVMLAYTITNNGGGILFAEITREVAATTWGWNHSDGHIVAGMESASAHTVVMTAEARLGLARGTLSGYATL